MIQLITIAILVAASIVALIMYIHANRELAQLQSNYDKLDKKYYDKQMDCAGLTCDIEAADRDNSKLRMKLSEFDVDKHKQDKDIVNDLLSINDIQNMKCKLERDLRKTIQHPIQEFQDITGVEIDSVYINLSRMQETTSKRQRLFGLVTRVDINTKI